MKVENNLLACGERTMCCRGEAILLDPEGCDPAMFKGPRDAEAI